MFGLAVILYALDRFGSPVLVGWVSFASLAPGLIVSPITGVLLDRLRAASAILIDMLLSAALLFILCLMDGTKLVGAPALLALVTVYSLTNPLSTAGIRALIPRLVPDDALEMANALDTGSYALVEVLGPAFAGGLFAFVGANATMLTIAILYLGGSLSLVPLLRQGAGQTARSPAPLLSEAMAGLAYVALHPSLRGLAASYSSYQLAWGVLYVTVPVFVARELGTGANTDLAIGLLWAVSGLAGGLGALLAGRARAAGREREIIGIGVFLTALAIYPLGSHFGLFGLSIGLTIAGLLAGPIDVGTLTLRQRRTEPGWLGRVLAVSMSLNLSGIPIGSAIGGWLITRSLSLALISAALASIAAAAMAFLLIPSTSRLPSRDAAEEP
jgi:predicted MFS family arabinose efflux permease